MPVEGAIFSLLDVCATFKALKFCAAWMLDIEFASRYNRGHFVVGRDQRRLPTRSACHIKGGNAGEPSWRHRSINFSYTKERLFKNYPSSSVNKL